MIKGVFRMKCGKYFNESEFACKCGNHGFNQDGTPCLDHVIDKRLVDLLDAIRERLGAPVYILSGYRCPEHNEAVGGVSNSQHVLGTAADITCDGYDVETIAQVAEECAEEVLGGGVGIGTYYYQQFVHVDVRGYDARWNDL